MICTDCGQETADTSKFCIHCGTPNATNLLVPASWGKRLSNHLIDIVLILAIEGGMIFGATFIGDRKIALGVMILGVASYVLYYLILESMFQTTVGKLITGTKVVNKEGNNPSFLQILGRSFARYIPFEPFSFLMRKYPTGWHDLLSGTYVVDKKMTPEQVRAIDPKVIAAQKSSSGWLIVVVVIVMIAIIGILSSVVLASLSTARAKGQEAAKQADVAALKVSGELYNAKNNSYAGFCEEPQVKALSKYSAAGLAYECNDSEKAWAASVPVGTKFGCVDSTEERPTLVAGPIGDRLSCPQVGTWTPTTARDQSFTVEFPGDPALETVKDVKATEEDPTITYTSDLYKVIGDGVAYLLIQHTYNKPFTAEERKTLIPAYASYFASTVKGKVTEQSYGDENGMSDGSFMIETDNGLEKVQAKVFLTKNVAYLLVVTSDAKLLTDAGFNHFADSFKIVKK
ncbi:MAG: hypothetical protein RJB39_370 [Candidatus Parcubacteria bacterium]|jgi:uncharacterized RDD family membrane protein YckC/type II secretory pathway pseudopilin PulG